LKDSNKIKKPKPPTVILPIKLISHKKTKEILFIITIIIPIAIKISIIIIFLNKIIIMDSKEKNHLN
jgi:hypothetical protein